MKNTNVLDKVLEYPPFKICNKYLEWLGHLCTFFFEYETDVVVYEETLIDVDYAIHVVPENDKDPHSPCKTKTRGISVSYCKNESEVFSASNDGFKTTIELYKLKVSTIPKTKGGFEIKENMKIRESADFIMELIKENPKFEIKISGTNEKIRSKDFEDETKLYNMIISNIYEGGMRKASSFNLDMLDINIDEIKNKIKDNNNE